MAHLPLTTRSHRRNLGIRTMMSAIVLMWKYFKNYLGALDGTHVNIHSDAKGLYGVPFTYYERLPAIYRKHISTREGVEGFGKAIANMEQEILMEDGDHEDNQVLKEVEKMSMASHSIGATSGKKRREKVESKVKSDPLLTMMGEVHGGLMKVSGHVGTMATAFIRDVEMQEKAIHEDPQQKLKEQAMKELKRLGFTGSEIVRCARVFVKTQGEIHMMMVVPDNLRREYMLEMLKGMLVLILRFIHYYISTAWIYSLFH
ncbi:hypothetical protein ACQ4PT_060478 [Festuca glaucescens]